MLVRELKVVQAVTKIYTMSQKRMPP